MPKREGEEWERAEKIKKRAGKSKKEKVGKSGKELEREG